MNSAIARAMQRSELIREYVKATPAGPLIAPGGIGGALGLGASQQNYARETERHNFGWVHAAVRVVAQRIAAQPVRVARRTSAPASDPRARMKAFRGAPPFVKQMSSALEPLEAHPFLTAISNPNPYLTAYALLYVTVFQLELTGVSHWWLRDGDGGSLGSGLEIYPIPSSWVKPVHEKGKPFDRYTVTPSYSGESFDIPGDEVARIAYPNPADPLLGQFSPLSANALAVSTDESIQNAQHRHFQNGVFPGMAVVIGRQPGIDGKPGDRPALNREQRAQIVTAFKQAYRGVYNAKEPLILDALIEDVRRITATAEELDFIGSAALTKERITQGFGVNPVAMGQVEGVNRASSAAADDHLVKNTVNPKITLISQCLSKWVAPKFGDDIVAFIEEAKASDPDSDRADRDLLARYGALTLNELRAAYHLEPIDGGDVLVEPGSGGLTITSAPGSA